MLSIDAWLDEKPYKELYDRVVYEKVSPQRTHAVVVAELFSALREWARGRGEAGVEWRVYLAEGTTLVPDVAFFFDKRLATLTAAQRETPPFAPDLAIEVRSPDDRESNIKRKTELYLAHGAAIVLNVDPFERTVQLSDAQGEKCFRPADILVHPAFPGLEIAVSALFAPLDRKIP
jgi:Uma2 family endonuclease